jgi:kinesin family protein 11
MVYQSVVGPVLTEVLSGYNCTVFAYGQTGTGKTHTMEGDLTALMGTYSTEAGIIPRTLYRLFHTLELSRDEYSVHASFVELYNEELRDLLSDDTPQPLVGGSNGTGLRMFEDKTRGVVIQGLEDMPMRDAEHGLRLLRKGSQKRQIAATKCNESSSRSHCVFSLTVHIKETTPKGEDVLRTGKLNLVDLAGSENIGRSGAANKQAREAGMINQSLLTLGRVINALVEKSSHVPYRESKLTRLLQESLGGRTKTCIIATVSPERHNLEETLSTLDYALRAKSIRNKPEVNQRMTRAALIKEYVNEIERLKGDLLASREKNGIFLSPESWQSMQDEHDGTRAQVEDLRRQGEVVESKMASLKEQFAQNMQVLVKKEAEASAVRVEYEEKEKELQSILSQISELQKAEAEERALRQQYMRSERRLDAIAKSLRQRFQESASDGDALFAKLKRKEIVDRQNRDMMAECQAALVSLSNQLDSRVSDFANGHDQFASDLTLQLREFQQREHIKLRANIESVEEHLQNFRDRMKASTSHLKDTKAQMDQLAEAIRKDGGEMLAAEHERNASLNAACQSLMQQVALSHREAMAGVRSGVEEMAELMMNVFKASRERATLDRKTFEEIRGTSAESMKKEMERLRTQNDYLTTLLSTEREKANVMRDALCKNVGQMITTFCQQRDQVFTTAMEQIRMDNEDAQLGVQAFTNRHNDQLGEALEDNQSSRETLRERERAAKAQRLRTDTALNQSGMTIERHVSDFTEHVSTGQREGIEQAVRQFGMISGNVDQICEIAEISRQRELKQLAEIRSCVEEGYEEIGAELQSTLEDVEETCEVAVEGLEEHRTHSAAFGQEAGEQLSALRNTARDYLTGRVQVDLPTGTTPQKRDWPGVKDWSLVQRPAADDSLASIDEGDLLELSQGASGKRNNEQQDVAVHAISKAAIRPSLPLAGTHAGSMTGMPLSERQTNRYSIAQPSNVKTVKKTFETGGSRLRLPSTTGGMKRTK